VFDISANIVCNNERFWIRESIMSIVHLVNEIVYVDDGSDDGSLEIARELSSKHSNIKIYDYSSHGLSNLGDLKNFALSKSSNEFAIRWDADFIAYDDIGILFEFCLKNRGVYDAYSLSGPNLEGDIYHQPIHKDFFGPECYLFKRSKIRFVKNGKYSDYPTFEKDTIFCYPQNTELKKNHYFMHMNTLKSVEKITYRKRMSEYQLFGQNKGYWNWLGEISKNPNIKEKEINNTISSKLRIKSFDFDRWGNHPLVLTESESSKIFNIRLIGNEYFIDYPIK